MSHTRWTKVIREITLRKTRTALVTASIFIGVLGVVTLFSMGDIIIGALQDTVQQDRLAMLRVYVTTSEPEATANLSFFDDLRALPQVEHVQGIAHYAFYWRHPGEDSQFTEGELFGYTLPVANLPLEPVELVEGRLPQPGQREIAVERRFASANGFSVGDPIVLRVYPLNGGTTTSAEETWTISGTVFQPYSYPVIPGSSTNIRADTTAYAALDDMQTMTGVAGINLILARYSDYPTAEAHQSEFETAIAQHSPYVPTITLIEDPAENSLIEQIRTFDAVLSLLAVVALVVAGFLVLNVINATVIEQRRHIGIMKSLGASAWDNTLIYTGIALVYGIGGMIPGVLLGVPLGYAITENIAPEFNIFLDAFAYSPQAVAIGVALGILVPVLAAIGPVLVGTRVTILEAITDRGIRATYVRGPLARLTDLLPAPTSLKQSLRNVNQKKGRLALTIITLALACGAFMGVYSTFASFDLIVENSLNQIGVDISIYPRGMDDFEQTRALLRDNIPQIKSIEPGISLAIDVEGYQLQEFGQTASYLIGVGINPANTDISQFRLRAGDGWENDPTLRGAVISSTIADGLGVTAGDTITITSGGNTGSYPILGVATYPFDAVWMRWEDLARLGGLTRGAPTPNDYLTLVTLDDRPTPAIGINELAQSALPITAGDFLTPHEPGLMVSTALAQRYNYTPGDELTVSASAGTQTLPITGVFDIPPALLPTDAPPGIPVDQVVALYWQDLAVLEGKPLDGEPLPSALDVVLTKAQPTRDETRAVIDQANDLLLAHGVNANFANWSLLKEGITQQLSIAETILNTAASLIAAVGAIGLLSALSMAVFERQKEIGVMRSVGATSYNVAFQFLVEGIIVGLIAWLLGIPFSYLLDQSLITAFQFEHVPEAAYTPEALVYGLAGMLIIVTVASLWPSIAAARKTVSDILRYQ